ncbi:MAG: hypothetical protein ACPGTU_03355, partial [Myxococcota bacterium]
MGCLGLAFAFKRDGVVLDSAFIPLRYAQRLGTGQGWTLEGHSVAVEGFTDPLWVAVLAGLRAVGIHEFKVQTYLGPGLVFVLLATLTVFVLTHHKKLGALLPVALFGSWAPLSVAAYSGSNSVWLSVLGLLSVMWAAEDIERVRLRRRTLVALILLVSTGLPGTLIGMLLAAMSGALLRKRLFMTVLLIALFWSCGRFLLFESLWSRAVEIRLETFSFSPLQAVFTAAPTLCILGLLGVMFGWGKGLIVRAFAGATLIWTLWACTGLSEPNSFFDAWLPAVTMLTVLGCQLWAAHRTTMIAGALSLVVLGGWSQLDWQTAAQVSQVNLDRQIELKQSQGMARFIRWRFLPDEWVAVHSPGAIPYHARRPFIDLSGTTEAEEISAPRVMERSPSGIVPKSNFVSTRPMRLPLDEAYRELVDKQYKQYAIQQQKKWKLVRAHPVWFHIYIRKDLPMLSPDISEEEGNQFPKTDVAGSAKKSSL